MVLVLALRRRGFFRVWGLVFAVLIVVDAYVNGALTPVRPDSGLATFFGISFVIVGDLRYFVAVEREKGRFFLPVALVLAFIVPLLSQLVRAMVPSVAANLRTTYLAYEVLFFGVLAAYYVLRVRRLDGAARAFATKLTIFEVAQYGLWIAIDVVLLTTKRDAAYLARIVPDAMYYVAMVPFVLRMAAKREASA